MSDKEQWYTNRELFELINNLQKEMLEMQKDMQATRHVIRKYNGLYDKLGEVKKDVDGLKASSSGKREFGDDIKSWSGWIFGLTTLIFMLIKYYTGG